MKSLSLLAFVFSVAFGAQAQQKYSLEECTEKVYTEAGAKTKGLAREVCEQRRDRKFIDCVVDAYQDIDHPRSLSLARFSCGQKISTTASSLQKQCASIYEQLGFDSGRAEELCEWSEQTFSLAIPFCVQRNTMNAPLNQDGEALVLSCYEQYRRGELDSRGFNSREAQRAELQAQ
ncbi:MAG: hypothetical protein AAGB31_00875, partial [Bdellovibrio sp.]